MGERGGGDGGGGHAAAELVGHEAHGGLGVLEEAAVAGAKVVEPGLIVGGESETVFGTLAIADGCVRAVETLLRKGAALGEPKVELALTAHHINYAAGVDIAKFIAWKYEVIASI